jgi:Uma2 family endonuclease
MISNLQTSMPANFVPALSSEFENSVVLRGISWETYERLLDETGENPNPHFFYNQGDLLIMTLSPEHEDLKDAFTALVNLLALETKTRFRGLGSATFKREAYQRGFEPDACFYFENEPLIRGKKRLNLTVDPPPDLVIEVDITHFSFDKLELYAEYNVPEVWHFTDNRVEILQLESGRYAKAINSLYLPILTAEALTEFMLKSESVDRYEWLEEIQTWARRENLK